MGINPIKMQRYQRVRENKARCKSKRAVSPLRIGEEVNAMAPEEECESEMLVRVRWYGRSVAVRSLS